MFTTKTKFLATESIDAVCPHCQSTGTTVLHISQPIAYGLYFIPTIPKFKTATSECSHCKFVLEQDKFPVEFTQAFKQAAAKHRTPISSFAGLVILPAAVLGVSTYQNNQNAQYINDPKAGDIYEVDVKGGGYSLMKVSAVNADSVYLLISNYQANKSKGLKQIKLKDDAFDPTPNAFSKTQLKALYEDGTINHVNRD